MPTGPPFQPDPSQLYAQEFDTIMRPEYDAQRAQLGVTQAANQKMAADYLAHIQGMQNPVAAQQVPNAPNPLMAGLAGFFAHLNASQTGSQVLPSALMNALAQAGHQRATVQAANADSQKDFALGKLKIEEEAYKGMLDMQHQAAVESGNLEAAFAAQKAKYMLANTQHKREADESEKSQERLSVANDKRIIARAAKVNPNNTPPDPKAVQGLARTYLAIGNDAFRNLGMGGGTLRQAAISEAFRMDPKANIGLASANYKANLGSVSNLQKITDAQSAWIDTADANVQMVKDAMYKIPNAGSRIMNAPLRNVASLRGDPNVAAFLTAVETARLEYLRVLSTAGGAGGTQLSDAQRKDMKKFAGDDFTPRQLIASFGILRQDSNNKKKMYERRIKLIQSRIPTGAPQTLEEYQQTEPEETAPQGQVLIFNPDTGELTPQ